MLFKWAFICNVQILFENDRKTKNVQIAWFVSWPICDAKVCFEYESSEKYIDVEGGES